MEESRKNTCKQDKKKKMAIKIGGGGGGGVIGAVVLLGSALATATFLVSAFAIKRRRQRRSDDSNDELSKGFSFLLPDSSHHPSSDGTAKMGVSQIDSASLVSNEILILDEKRKLETNGDGEIIFSDIPKEPESTPLFDDSIISTKESSSLKPENLKENDSSTVIEVITDEEEPVEAAQADQITVEDIPLRPILNNQQEEKECSDDENIIIEKCEEVDMQLNEEQESPTDGIGSFEAYKIKQQVFDIPSDFEPQNVNNNCSIERPLFIESVQVMEEDEEIEAVHGDQIAIEDGPQMQLTQEEQDEGEYDGEIIAQKCEDQVAGEDAQQTLVKDDQDIIFSDKSAPEIGPLEKYDVKLMKEEDHIAIEDNPPMELIEKEEYNGVETIKVDMVAVDDNPPMELIEKEEKEDYNVNETIEVDMVAVDDNPPMALIEKEDYDSVETIEVAMVAVDDNPQMQSSEDDDEDDDDDDEEDIVEIVEEGSEGTGDSSMESNVEAIWPAESMQELSLEFKEFKTNNQNSEENSEEDRTVAMTFSERYMATQNDQPTNPWKRSVWIWSALLPLWCLCYCYFGVPFLKICLVVILAVVLFKFHEV